MAFCAYRCECTKWKSVRCRVDCRRTRASSWSSAWWWPQTTDPLFQVLCRFCCYWPRFADRTGLAFTAKRTYRISASFILPQRPGFSVTFDPVFTLYRRCSQHDRMRQGRERPGILPHVRTLDDCESVTIIIGVRLWSCGWGGGRVFVAANAGSGCALWAQKCVFFVRAK